MNEQVGAASHAGTLAPMAVRSRCEAVRVWEPSPKKLSSKDSLSAGVYLAFHLAAYLTAGFAGLSFIEWAWMRIFG